MSSFNSKYVSLYNLTSLIPISDCQSHAVIFDGDNRKVICILFNQFHFFILQIVKVALQEKNFYEAWEIVTK